YVVRTHIECIRLYRPLDSTVHLYDSNPADFHKRPCFRIRRQGVAQKRNHFSHAAENAVARWKDLHDGDRVHTRGLHRLARPKEIDVRGLAGQDSFVRRECVRAHCAAAVKPVTFAPSTLCICLSANICASGSNVATQSAGTSTAESGER